LRGKLDTPLSHIADNTHDFAKTRRDCLTGVCQIVINCQPLADWILARPVPARQLFVNDRQGRCVDPDLARSAVEAVSQWRYTPTLLNGEPIEVDTSIMVNFSLAQ